MNIHVVMCHIIQFRMTVYWYASVLYIKHSFKLIVISVDMIDPAVVYHCWETGWEYWRNQSLYKRLHKTRSFGNANFYWIVRVWWSYETVRMSRTKFLTGTKSFKGAAKSDRPVTLRQSRANVSKVGEMIESDGRYTIRDVAKAVDISLSWVHLILKRILKVRKISARGIPHILMDDQKMGTSTNHWVIAKLFPKFNQSLFAKLIHVLLLVKKNGYTISNQ